MSKLKLILIGLLQAIGVVVYCFLIGGFLWYMGSHFETAPDLMGITLWLSLIVFSAAVTGSMVFGYSAYLFINHKIKEAIRVFLYTIIWIFVILSIILLILI